MLCDLNISPMATINLFRNTYFLMRIGSIVAFCILNVYEDDFLFKPIMENPL
jgi:hypothetical protein